VAVRRARRRLTFKADQGWVPIAVEGQRAALPAPQTLVRYGPAPSFANQDPGPYTYTVRSGVIDCTNGGIGFDPAPGRVKLCQVKGYWTRIAGETENFPADLMAPIVCYGGLNNFSICPAGENPSRCWQLLTSSQLSGGGCNNTYFGGDMLMGKVKSCDRAVPGEPTWTHCADEGQFDTCRITGVMDVRYGANGVHVIKRESRARIATPNGTIPCNNPNFFGDPVPGVTKTCEVTPVG
jgi:hypothetical protein